MPRRANWQTYAETQKYFGNFGRHFAILLCQSTYLVIFAQWRLLTMIAISTVPRCNIPGAIPHSPRMCPWAQVPLAPSPPNGLAVNFHLDPASYQTSPWFSPPEQSANMRDKLQFFLIFVQIHCNYIAAGHLPALVIPQCTKLLRCPLPQMHRAVPGQKK